MWWILIKATYFSICIPRVCVSVTINHNDAFVSDRLTIFCRHCVDQQTDSLVTEFQPRYRQWRHWKVGVKGLVLPHCIKIWEGHAPSLPHGLFHYCLFCILILFSPPNIGRRLTAGHQHLPTRLMVTQITNVGLRKNFGILPPKKSTALKLQNVGGISDNFATWSRISALEHKCKITPATSPLYVCNLST